MRNILTFLSGKSSHLPDYKGFELRTFCSKLSFLIKTDGNVNNIQDGIPYLSGINPPRGVFSAGFSLTSGFSSF